MSLKETQDISFIPITLLSNGSYELYNENSLTFFSNRLHKAIKLDPSLRGVTRNRCELKFREYTYTT